MLLVIKEAAEKAIKSKENKEKQNEGETKEEVGGEEKKKANKGKHKQVVSEVNDSGGSVVEGSMEAITLWNELPQALKQAAMCFGRDSIGKGVVNGVKMAMWIKVSSYTVVGCVVVGG